MTHSQWPVACTRGGGGGGGLEPLPLWGPTLKCPCGPVCAILTILICRVCCLRRAPSPGRAPSQLQKIKNKNTRPRPPRSHLNADHNWWTTMPVKRHQQSSAKKKKSNFQVGYIQNQVLRLYIYILFYFGYKTDLSQQQPLKWLKMHYIKTMRQPCWNKLHYKWHCKPSTFNHKKHTFFFFIKMYWFNKPPIECDQLPVEIHRVHYSFH